MKTVCKTNYARDSNGYILYGYTNMTPEHVKHLHYMEDNGYTEEQLITVARKLAWDQMSMEEAIVMTALFALENV